ncbi:MAG: alpha/beta hydrolase [Candidatus Rifleibacteriota bacterium]
MNRKKLLQIAIILVIFGVSVFYLQDRLIFIPSPWPQSFTLPERLDNCNLTEIFFDTTDGQTLHAVKAEPFSGKAKHIILFSHGNAGNIVHRLNKTDHLCKLGFSVFLYDYRGYGKSTGRPTVAGTFLDGEAALDYVINKEKYQKKQIILYGESLGTGISAHLIGSDPNAFAGLVHESGFASLGAQANRRFPFIGSLLLKKDMPSLATISHYRGKLMVIHSKSDETIPISDSEMIFEACPSPEKRFVVLERAKHNDPVWKNKIYQDAWTSFKYSLDN